MELLDCKYMLEFSDEGINRFGIDTEGTGRENMNVLYSPIRIELVKDGKTTYPESKYMGSSEIQAAGIHFKTLVSNKISMTFKSSQKLEADTVNLIFDFAPNVVMTSLICSNWNENHRFTFPSILSFPDLGQLLMTSPQADQLQGNVTGDRYEKWYKVSIEIPAHLLNDEVRIDYSPLVLPIPEGFTDEKRWRMARRGWFNLIQTSNGGSGGGEKVKGVWANNSLSDPVSSVLHVLVDAAILVPTLAPGVTMAGIIKRTVDFWLNKPFKPGRDGVVSYTGGDRDDPDIMDSNPSMMIGAWAYYTLSGDKQWLIDNIDKLEYLGKYLKSRDVDSDGLIESTQTGNRGDRPPRNADCAWDCYASGHKNAYINSLCYRAFNCMAEIYSVLGNEEMEKDYLRLAQRIKTAYYDEFYNKETGLICFWRSLDGELHEIYMDAPGSIGIEYGLIDKQKGAAFLESYWKLLNETGFNRFDLGIPLNLKPVPRDEMELYFEFEHFLNGGCGVSNTSYLLTALYVCGMDDKADRILDAMLKRQHEGVFSNGGGFQNGFVDSMGSGAEVYDWKGNTTGYEGHLVYVWAFLHSMLMKEDKIRKKLRPN